MFLLSLLACAPADLTDPACNGVPGLCDVPLDAVALPATHNAMSNADEGWIAPNQQHPPRDQLTDGIRGMLLDVYDEAGELTLCHGPCALGSTPLAEVLGELAAFLEANPSEVITLVFQDAVPAERLRAAFVDAGLADLMITPSGRGSWPTLGELIADGRRLLVTRESGGDGPADLRPFYDLGWDTPYSFRRPEDFSCEPLRGDPAQPLFLVNHWISDPLPNRTAAATVNTADALHARLEACEARWGRGPTLLAVDHYDVGDLFEVIDARNRAVVGDP